MSGGRNFAEVLWSVGPNDDGRTTKISLGGSLVKIFGIFVHTSCLKRPICIAGQGSFSARVMRAEEGICLFSLPLKQ